MSETLAVRLVPVRFRINGEERDELVQPRKLLSDFIREDLGLTGTHIGCEHGVCGACTILLDNEVVRSCLMFAAQAEGASISTIESVASDPDSLHPIQQAFWDKHGLQCGFCTPGMILTTKVFLEANPNPTDDEIREAIAGNICRCTGYQFIVESIKTAAERALARQSEGGRG
jgi:aerobic carbon-monoxide dehydrogenase small subunit